MKRFRTNIIICLVMLLSATIFSSISFAGTGSPEQPPSTGEPPYGMAIHGVNGGTKLSGTIVIEYGLYESSHYCFDSKIVLRLSKNGNTMTTFVATGCLAGGDPGTQQTQITSLLGPEILSYFFPGNTALTIDNITMTYFGQYVLAPLNPDCAPPGSWCHDDFIMADVSLAVK